MKTYIVTIEQAIITRIRVDAKSAHEARTAIKEYGPLEAAKDFPVLTESSEDRIKKVEEF